MTLAVPDPTMHAAYKVGRAGPRSCRRHHPCRAGLRAHRRLSALSAVPGGALRLLCRRAGAVSWPWSCFQRGLAPLRSRCCFSWSLSRFWPTPGSAPITPASSGTSGPDPTSCTGAQALTTSAGGLLDALQTTSVIRCDEAAWRFARYFARGLERCRVVAGCRDESARRRQVAFAHNKPLQYRWA